MRFWNLWIALCCLACCSLAGCGDDKKSAGDTSDGDVQMDVADGLDTVDLDTTDVADTTDTADASDTNDTQEMSVPVPVQVTIANGTLEGVTQNGVSVFHTIPYAAPPVGALRWTPPQPAADWAGVLDATEGTSSCAQINLTTSAVTGDEDCLHLNVYAPEDVSTPKPVMVWIHGGGFISGNGTQGYPSQPLVQQGDVIVVTINYRLGPLGFYAHPELTAEDTVNNSSGNYGFMDQQFALQWVEDNIAAFGGDPEQVTLFGESAGGFSVCFHLLSNGSSGLFDGAIIQSGACAFDIWATLADLETRGAEFATTNGCTGMDIATCMRGKTIEELYTVAPTENELFFGDGYAWVPNVDGTIITDQPLTLLADPANPVPLLLGTNKDEGNLFTTIYPSVPRSVAEFDAWLEERFGLAAVAEVKMQYPVAADNEVVPATSQIITDSIFVCPARETARLWAGGTSAEPTYRYKFELILPSILFSTIGAAHGLDVLALFDTTLFDLAIGPDERPAHEDMVGFWTTFAATGDPNDGNRLTWPAYSAMAEENMVLDVPLSVRTDDESICDFWATHPPARFF